MLTYEDIKAKGFEKIVYSNQVESPVFYSQEFNDKDIVARLHRVLGESTDSFDYDLSDICCVLEIREDLTEGQYLFKEKELLDDYFVFDPLTPAEFEELLNLL